MKKFKVSFYTKHNPNLQSSIIHAASVDMARKMFEVTGCAIESVEEIETCTCFEMIGDNRDCPDHHFGGYCGPILDDSTAFDKERDELRTWAQGG